MAMQMDAYDVTQHIAYLSNMAQLAWVNVHNASTKGDEDRYRRYAQSLEDALTEAKKILAFLTANPPVDTKKHQNRMRKKP